MSDESLKIDDKTTRAYAKALAYKNEVVNQHEEEKAGAYNFLVNKWVAGFAVLWFVLGLLVKVAVLTKVILD